MTITVSTYAKIITIRNKNKTSNANDDNNDNKNGKNNKNSYVNDDDAGWKYIIRMKTK